MRWGFFSVFVLMGAFSGTVGAEVFPYHESFESGLGRWTLEGDRDWTWKSGPTGSFDTGPDAAYDRDYYMYTEASGYSYTTFQMLGTFDVSTLALPRLTLRYHMYGADMGSLLVDVNVGNGWQNVGALYGEHHAGHSSPWTKAVINLSSYISSNLQIRITGITGDSFRSDICIDDIWVFESAEEQIPFKFSWGTIADRQTKGLAFPVEIRALDYLGRTLSTFNQAVELSAWSDGFADPCQNRDFNGGTLAYWTPLNSGVTPGPYEVYDSIYGDGTAFCFKPDATIDGISQEITLTGGETYYLSANFAWINESTSVDKTATYYGAIQINGTSVDSLTFTYTLPSNSQLSWSLSGTFTPPADGTYTVSLVASTGSAEDSNIWAYFDDVSVNFAAAQFLPVSPSFTAQFVNGVWTGDVTVDKRLPSIHLIARYGDLVFDSSLFSTYTSPLDLDGDGMLDSWEMQYFPSAEACVASVDSDSDGYSNMDEYIIGTIPNVKSSSLGLASTVAGSNQCLMGWNSVSGRVYVVQWTPDLLYTPFADLSGDIPHPQGCFTNDTSTGGSLGFYRVKVRKQ